MSEKSIALALIVKNEEKHLERCILSFQGAFDELVVCDTGSTDKTIEIAQRYGAKIVHHEWKDDFGAARQASFDACQSTWAIWADADDVLREGDAQKIRWIVGSNQAELYRCGWRVNNHIADRERIVRRDAGQWFRNIHEEFRPHAGKRVARVQDILVEHSPLVAKPQNHDRNIETLEKNLKNVPSDLFYLCLELANRNDPRAHNLILAALQLGLGDVERYELLFSLAFTSKDPADRRKYALSAYYLMPHRTEAMVLLCQDALQMRQDKRALSFARAMMSLPKPKEPIWTLQHNWYEWERTDLYTICLRRNGLHEEAFKFEIALRGSSAPNFSLIHATRGRPKKMLECRDLWMKTAKNPHLVEHIFAVDSDDKEVIQAASCYPCVMVPAGGGCVAAWNAAAQVCSGKVLIQLSDDWVPPKHWDDLLLKRLGPKINEEAVVAVSDGIIRENGKMTDLMCIAIMTRDRYEFQGHMFYEGYMSVYSDNEFTDRAYADGVVIEARDLIFQHEHFITGKVECDKTYLEQNALERYQKGQETYLQRKQPKRGLERKYAAFILAAKDDLCLVEVCERILEEGVETIYIGIPTEYWNGTKNPSIEEDSIPHLDAVLDKFGAHKPPRIVYSVLDVAKHRAPGRDVLQTEAMVRNEMLAKIRVDGFEHVVVVDGDELWMRGTLLEIDRYISDNKPTSLNCRMIPVAGLPGYPIEGAKDAAMVYLGPGAEFNLCRGSTGIQRTYPRRLVMHFSATRKTMDEIIQKHRESGHYTDPNYDFEGWIHNTLPNIKPGMKRAHMYRPWDTWPLVREFTRDEWNQIPDSIKPYLGEPQ